MEKDYTEHEHQLIDFAKTYPTKDEFKMFDVECKVMSRFNEHLRGFSHMTKKAPSKKYLIEYEMQEQEAFRDGKRWITTSPDGINLYPFFKDGWSRAIIGEYNYPNNAYKFYDEVKGHIQKKYRNNSLPQHYFETLVTLCFEEAIEGMARGLYYLWLTEGCNDQEQPGKAGQLPTVLEHEDAKAIFARAESAGLIKVSGLSYEWKGGTKQLLAYFAEKVSIKLNLSKKLDKDGKKTINWRVFEIVFDVKNLKDAKNDWLKYNTKFTPNGFEEIDKII